MLLCLVLLLNPVVRTTALQEAVGDKERSALEGVLACRPRREVGDDLKDDLNAVMCKAHKALSKVPQNAEGLDVEVVLLGVDATPYVSHVGRELASWVVSRQWSLQRCQIIELVDAGLVPEHLLAPADLPDEGGGADALPKPAARDGLW